MKRECIQLHIDMTMSWRLLLFLYSMLQSSSSAFVIPKYRESGTACRISSGFSFQGDNQILISAQKPLGLILEEQEDASISVVEMDETGSAAKAGVKIGDVLLSVQNASVENVSLEQAMTFIARSPKVVNLRFARTSQSRNVD
jgi:S1-C subfamily serine protease